LEYRRREQLGYPLHLINIRGIVRSFTLKNLLVPFLVVTSLWQASRLLRRFRPQVVIGTGGYVAWPVGRAAISAGIPLVLQEQNSYPGIVTRRLAARASKLFLGFEEARRYLPETAATRVTGNPVRRSLLNGNREAALKKFKLDPRKKTILVLGGSQGARAINRAVLRSLQNTTWSECCQLLWQTGKRGYTEVVAQAGDRVTGHTLFPFADDMAAVYAAADIAIARAGALTLAELEACRVPAVLIPYPYAAGDHQRKNAQSLVARDCARLLNEEELSHRDILAVAAQLLTSGEAEQMKRHLATSAPKEPAVDVIAREVIAIAQQQLPQEERIAD
ncbi:MAG: UDP-N-acetylglucosamine--N-acetylmuramyl-(pentapeptide) pyrophosphoryl-undecaprenol N-acetylglucosamine transferase, partial [Candidatus Zixiibacteriota bacterium]